MTQSCFAWKRCTWKRTAAGWTRRLQKSPGYRILISLTAEAGNAQPSAEGIGVGKRIKQHNSKAQVPVCVGGKTFTTCFPTCGCPSWEMICGCFRSVYISTQTTRTLLCSCHVLPALGKRGLLHSEGKSLGSLGIVLLLSVCVRQAQEWSLSGTATNKNMGRAQDTRGCSSLPFRQKSFKVFPCLAFILVPLY